MSKYAVFPGPYTPAFGLNEERYGVSLRIQSECRKIRTKNTPYLDPFHAVVIMNVLRVYNNRHKSQKSYTNQRQSKVERFSKIVNNF